jgi:DnaK suppressor protein
VAKRAHVMDALKAPAAQEEARRTRWALELILRERRRLLQGEVSARSMSPDPIEAAQDLEEEEVWLAVLDQSREAQTQVAEALHLLAEGRYGRCVSCGKLIPAARLRALPFALRCLLCQERFEAEKTPKTALVSSVTWGSFEWK